MKVKIKVNFSSINAELNANVQIFSLDFSKCSPQAANFCEVDDRTTEVDDRTTKEEGSCEITLDIAAVCVSRPVPLSCPL